MRAMSLGRAERKPDEREPEQKRDADRGAGELLVVQAEQARIVRRHEQRRQRDRQSRNGQDEAHHCRRLRAAIRPPRAARDRPSVRRWGRSAITASRSVSLIVAQAVISVARATAADAQSRQRIENADVDAGRGDGRHGPYLGGRMPDEKSAPGGDLAALLRSAGDVAGLSADRAARQRDHAQSPGAAHERGEERMGEPKRDKTERERNDQGRAPGGGERVRIEPASRSARAVGARRRQERERRQRARRGRARATKVRLSAARQNPPSSAAASAPTRRMSASAIAIAP